MSSSLEHIGSKAFLNCTSLFSVYFGKFTIETNKLLRVYELHQFEEITTPRNLSVIGDRAFYNCHAMDHFIYAASSESLTYIGYEVFHSIHITMNCLPDPKMKYHYHFTI